MFGYHLLKVIDKKQARGEVEVSHILLRTGTTDDSKVKNKAFEVFDQLKAGRPWDEVCKENSDDTNTKDSGGRLRAFGVGALPSVPEFENTAFALQKPGDLSDPFQSSIGWHIIRLEKKIPLPPYSELEASLKRKVARDERLQLSQQAMVLKRRKDFQFKEVTENKEAIFSYADSSVTKEKWKYSGPAELLGKKLFSTQTKEFTIGNFVDYLRVNQASSALSPAAYMDQLYNYFVDETITLLEEERLKIEKPEYKNLLTEYSEGILFFEIMEKEIWNKASEDTLGQRNYYEKNALKYQGGNRVRARIFSTPTKSIVEDFKHKINNGDTLRDIDLKKFKSVQPFRNYEKGESKIIDKLNWVTGLQEVELDKNYYLIEISQLVAPGVKSFEEARAGVISDFQNELEQKWLNELRKKYPVVIDNKGKKSVLSELIKK